MVLYFASLGSRFDSTYSKANDHSDTQESERQEVRAEEDHATLLPDPETKQSEQEPEVSDTGVCDLRDAFRILVEGNEYDT